ncbi:pyrrolo-quinoline quinone [Halovivax asiaticus JCM 14624]|uniref:Pyrrolo-quinoline quinone n=1 Tax=Halovivax asiaticus JCM 14624 TaxID=1227490 RepID=M0BN08_9EURY|nr:pyrrolo-quinoline quinone [Halovivax asiaticus JCM 14624]
MESTTDGPGPPALDAITPLGQIEPARSRHMWRRSGVCVHDGLVVACTWNGEIVAFDVDGGSDECALTERWRRSIAGHPVTVAAVDDALVVGCRGDRGRIAALDRADGTTNWSYEGVADVGEASSDSVFHWPYVVAVVDDGDGGCVAAVRRYEHDGQDRRWHSAILRFDADGAVRWRDETDASVIAIDRDAAGDHLAVAYNRCGGDHQHGLVVLEAASGSVVWDWDPGTEGERRVGDVTFDRETGALVAASHGDYCGYLFDSDGAVDATGSGSERSRVELATEHRVGDQTLYAYPTHAYAHDGRVVFVTGNTYARDAREIAGRHPGEHTAFGYHVDGDTDAPQFRASTGGFVTELAAAGSTVVLPSAQHFRDRDPATHAIRVLDITTGAVAASPTEGIVTAASTDGQFLAAIEEPIAYHDDEGTLGAYALHVGRVV